MTKPNLLLLHGALGSKEQFDPLLPLLDKDFLLHRLNFEGHADRPDQGRPFLARTFAQNVLDYLDANQIKSTSILGYSLGGYVACTLAEEHGTRVEKIITLGTCYLWDSATVEREAKFLDPDIIESKVPKFARLLEGRHTAIGWKKMLEMTLENMWANAAEGGFSAKRMADIDKPIRIIVGDSDSTAGLEESLQIYRSLQNGELEVYPKTPHPLERVDLVRLANSVKEFCG